MLRYIASALRHGPSDPVEKLLFIALLEHANKQGVCWPSRRLLGEYAQASPATITRKLRMLQVKGWIQRKQRFNSSTLFRLNINRLEEREAADRRAVRCPKGWEPFEDEKPQPVENKGDAHSEHTDAHSEHTDAHKDHLNPLMNPLMKKEPAALNLDDLGRFAQTCLREGKPVPLGNGHTLKPNDPEYRRLSDLLRKTNC